MQACHWKAHNTFTNFYLKDLTWSDNDNNLYLGPVVAAQQVPDPSPQSSHPRKEKKGGHIRYNQIFRSLISNSNSNSTFIALNLYLMIDSKTQKAKIRDRNR